MFSESAELYDLIYAEFKDYAAEAEQVAEVVLRWRPEARSILDLGCGTGRHAALLTESLGSAVDGLDINEDFVDMAAARCPAGRFTKGDMSEFDLGRSYDVIL